MIPYYARSAQQIVNGLIQGGFNRGAADLFHMSVDVPLIGNVLFPGISLERLPALMALAFTFWRWSSSTGSSGITSTPTRAAWASACCAASAFS